MTWMCRLQGEDGKESVNEANRNIEKVLKVETRTSHPQVLLKGESESSYLEILIEAL